MQFILNGQPIGCKVHCDKTLLHFLRDDLRLTGTKEGCDHQGHCGTCTVLVDGQAKFACLLKVADVNDRQVLTIEGLADAESNELHRLQQAFAESGAVQCGFCTPGLIIEAKALLDQTPQPSIDEIKRALNRTLCRCTGYTKIIKAVQAAAGSASSSAGATQAGASIGVSVPKSDAVGKVTGQTLFSADLFMEDMLYGQVLWSAHPHANIVALDTATAEAMPGVQAVLTAKDVPGLNLFGAVTADQPVLAEDRVRCISDAVALVFAETPELAAAALEKVQIEYRPLPGVFSPQEALRPEAPKLHDEGNVLTHLAVQTGDVAAALEASDAVVDDRYFTPSVDQGFLEPEAGLAVANEDGSLTIWTGVQNPFDIRRQVAVAIGLPAEKVQIINVAVGGAFGGKCDVSLQIFLALGALRTHRPVKMVFSRAESLRFHPKRHAFEMRYCIGATRAGKLTGIELEITGDTGAYASWGQIALQSVASFVCGAYVVPNSRVSLVGVYTNNPPSGAWRGFGVPQAHVALESQMDRLARRLDIDPFEFRALNALEPGKPTYMGQIVQESVGFTSTLASAKKALAKIRPQIEASRSTRKIGVGVACGFKSVGFPLPMADSAGALVEVDPSGQVLLYVGCPDLGQGSDTALAQIAAEVLGLPPGQVKMQQLDTSLSPDAGPSVASRSTYLGGNAAVGAAKALRAKLISTVAEIFDRDEAALHFQGGRFVDYRAEEELITLEALAARQSESLHAEYRFVEGKKGDPAFPVHLSRPNKSPEDFYYTSYAYATQVAIVEVDENTGRVRVRHIIAAHDVGKAIHPQNIEGQIEGSCLMGMGTALTEHYLVENGWNLTDTLAKCGLTRIRSAPAITTLIIEDEEPAGPFGAKGIAEVAAIPTAPAILNAIYDAVGVRITALPATPKRVRQAILARDKSVYDE